MNSAQSLDSENALGSNEELNFEGVRALPWSNVPLSIATRLRSDNAHVHLGLDDLKPDRRDSSAKCELLLHRFLLTLQ
jgi:hypothetical protein